MPILIIKIQIGSFDVDVALVSSSLCHTLDANYMNSVMNKYNFVFIKMFPDHADSGLITLPSNGRSIAYQTSFSKLKSKSII